MVAVAVTRETSGTGLLDDLDEVKRAVVFTVLIPLFNELLEVHGIGMKVNYGLNKLRFPAPVPVGSRIRLAGKVADVTEVEGGAQVTMAFTVEIEGAGRPACVAEAVYRFYS
ncbi:hypothetical protein ACIBHX_25825 [Nonomuraea sp. NPDC050536]|uniref:hypothetical protein n=1 Tax=Nonomuraea sp. NPDC050536 TaxID=3364366 RepID=UPI0037CCAA6C